MPVAAAGETLPHPQRSRFPLPSLWLIAIAVMAAIAIIGLLSYRALAAQTSAQIISNLTTIAHSRAEDLRRWYADRLEHGLEVGRNPFVIEALNAVQQPIPDPYQADLLRDWMRSMRAAHGYAEVLLLSPDLTVLASDPPGQPGLDPERSQLALRALATGQPRLTSLHSTHKVQTSPIGLHLEVIAPSGRVADNGGLDPAGVIVLRLDPAYALFPILDDWPLQEVPGTLQLIDGNEQGIRVAAESAEQGPTAPPRRLDFDFSDGDRLLRIDTPQCVTRSDGQEVYGVAHPIGDSPWTLFAQLPASAIDGARSRIAGIVALVTALAALSSVGALGFLWWRLRGSEYRRLWQHEQELSRALKQERAQLAGLFDGVDEIIYVADPETYELLYVNQHFRNILGQDSLGQRCHKVLQNRDAPCPFCTNDKIFGEYLGRTYVWEFQNEITRRWYRCADKAIRWSDGRLVRFELASDITDERIMDQQRIQLEKLGALGQLTAGVAHELNNPLMGIINGIQYCRVKTPDDDKRQQALQNAEHHTHRCMKIVEGLLAFSRSDQMTDAQIEPLDVTMLVERVTQLLDYRFRKAGITVEQTIADDLGKVWLPGPQFEQILINLLTNAIDAVADRPEKHIQIEVRRDADMLILEVGDNGAGIDEATQTRIFEPFFTTKAPGKGTGLGLSTTWSLVDACGGSIEVESEPDNGTRLRLRFPQPEGSQPPAQENGKKNGRAH
jgi:C4-dicarboxylate-specific signal transduction histidine kinase